MFRSFSGWLRYLFRLSCQTRPMIFVVAPMLLPAQLFSASVEASRHALVIGNASYAEGGLSNTLNDAQDMAARLRTYGFDVDLHTDADQRTMEKAIDALTRQLTGDGKVGLFYFAGHGVESQGRNYLIPIGADIGGEVDLKYEAVDAGRILDGMDAAGNGLNLVVLDACRNNPYRSAFRSASRGLARMSPARGALVLYATQPGAVASDGSGRNGVFTKHLLSAMDAPDLEVEQVFKRTALAVDRETGGSQTPWVEGVVLGNFAFRGADAGSGSVEQLNPQLELIESEPSPPPPPMAEPLGHLQINVNTSARVRLDGRAVGEAAPGRPLNLSSLSVGDHRLAVSATNHVDQELSVRVTPNTWAQEVVTLQPKNQPAPPPTPVYVPEPPPPAKSLPHRSFGYEAQYRHISSPSFRCSGKLRPVEQIICDDGALGRSDGIMGAIYQDLRRSLSKSSADRVRKAQRQWIKQRDRACPSNSADLRSSSRVAQVAGCVRSHIEQRSAELWSQLQSVVGR